MSHPSETSVHGGASRTAGPGSDPPTTFDVSAAVPLPDAATRSRFLEPHSSMPLALVGTTAYVMTPDALLVTDVTTGEITRTIRPDRESVYGEEDDRGGDMFQVAPPALADLDGSSTVVAPYLVEVPGSGTTPTAYRFEIQLVDAGTATVTRSLEIALPSSFELPPERLSYPPLVKGIANGLLVLDHNESTYAIDLSSGTVRWTNEQVRPSLLVDSVVVGIKSRNASLEAWVTGLDVSTGDERWVDEDGSYELAIAPAGPRHVLVLGRNYLDGENYYRFADPATGETSGDSDRASTRFDLACWYDAASVVVCRSGRPDNPAWVGAFDATTGEWLWNLPDEQASRIAPAVSTAWHGAVYGFNGNGPVVLDARTGEDRETNPGIAPVLVNEKVGIALSRGTAFAYPALS